MRCALGYFSSLEGTCGNNRYNTWLNFGSVAEAMGFARSLCRSKKVLKDCYRGPEEFALYLGDDQWPSKVYTVTDRGALRLVEEEA